MFDVSFVELMIVAVVALIVLGPEKLPAAARTLGAFVRRARASWNAVRSEFEREVAAEELKKSMREASGASDLGNIAKDLERAATDVSRTLQDANPVDPGIPEVVPTKAKTPLPVADDQRGAGSS
jgi:sec-independent protein translocase protein TatB